MYVPRCLANNPPLRHLVLPPSKPATVRLREHHRMDASYLLAVLMMTSHQQLDQFLFRVPFLPLYHRSHPHYLIAHSNPDFHHQFQSQAQLRPPRSLQHKEMLWV